MKYAIILTFETKRSVPRMALNSAAGAAFAQLEELPDEHGIDYSKASLYVGEDHALELSKALNNAVGELFQYSTANAEDGLMEKARVRAIKWGERVLKAYRERKTT